MDLSDGLGDAVLPARRMSGTGAKIDGELLPVAPAATAWFAARGARSHVARQLPEETTTSCSSPSRRDETRALKAIVSQARGVAVTRIGHLVDGPDVALVREGRAEPIPEGFVHF